MAKLFSLKENQDSADISIYGIIGYNEEFFGDGTNNKAYPFISLIKDLEKKYKRINIHINSPGGIIDDGLAIYNTIKNSSSEIHTYNDGITASMASIIMLAGHVKHFNRSSVFHLHSPWTITVGNKKQHDESIKQLDTYENVLIQTLKENTSLDEEAIKNKWFDGNDHFMSADEAKEFGFADEIIEKPLKNQFKAAASLNYEDIYNSFRKKTFSEKVTNFFKSNNQVPNSNQKRKTMNKIFKTLMAFLFVDALIENEEEKIVLDKAQISKIEFELSRLQTSENSLIEAKATIQNHEKENQDLKASKESNVSVMSEKDTELNTLKQTIAAHEANIAELNAKLETTPASTSTTVKTTNPVSDGVDWETINGLPHNRMADEYFS